MKSRPLIFVALLAASGYLPAATAADDYKTASKQAATRYAEDKKLCAEESTSASRMQCLRDARAEYDKALAAAKKDAAASKSGSTAKVCADCGKVLGVAMEEKKGEGGPIGMIAGGVAGAVIGHQVGGGTGKDLATIAGAAGGAYAGHKIEEKVRSTKVWNVRVRLDNGEERSFGFDHDPGFAAGDPVRLSGGSIVRR